MDHLVRIGTAIYLIPESFLDRVDADYGECAVDWLPELPSGEYVWKGAAEWLRSQGF